MKKPQEDEPFLGEYYSKPILYPTFEAAGGQFVAYGPEACARMLMDHGDIYINVDEGFAHAHYIPLGHQRKVASWVLRLGGNPELYRCLREAKALWI